MTYVQWIADEHGRTKVSGLGEFVLIDVDKGVTLNTGIRLLSETLPKLSPTKRGLVYFADDIPHKGEFVILDIKKNEKTKIGTRLSATESSEFGITDYSFLNDSTLIFCSGSNLFSLSLESGKHHLLLTISQRIIKQAQAKFGTSMVALLCVPQENFFGNGELAFFDTSSDTVSFTGMMVNDIKNWSPTSFRLGYVDTQMVVMDVSNNTVTRHEKIGTDSLSGRSGFLVDDGRFLFFAKSNRNSPLPANIYLFDLLTGSISLQITRDENIKGSFEVYAY